MFGNSSTMDLQATLAAASASNTTLPTHVIHHPITCKGDLRYEEDGTFACEHCEVPPDDARTQACVIHSVALMIIELALQL